MKLTPFEPLDAGHYREVVRRALAEDLGWGDVTTEATVDGSLRAKGAVVAKCECVIAGLEVAAEVFRQLDPAAVVTVNQPDGTRVKPGDVVAEVRGAAGAMLTAERTALNFLQRLSGIATMTRTFVDAAAGRITILDTRKTTPTMRARPSSRSAPAPAARNQRCSRPISRACTCASANASVGAPR